MQEGKHLIRDEDENPLTEHFVESSNERAFSKRFQKFIKRFGNKVENDDKNEN